MKELDASLAAEILLAVRNHDPLRLPPGEARKLVDDILEWGDDLVWNATVGDE